MADPAVTPAELFDLTGRTALVTGGGTHLGRAMAEAFADQGANVYIGGRRVDVVEATAAEIDARPNGTCRGMRLDVTDPDLVAAVVDQIATETAPLDIVVCNAGAGYEKTFPPDTALDEFRATLETHLMGTLTSAQAAAHQMVERGSGSIITIGSIHGSLTADPRIYARIGKTKRSGPAYQAAKAGIISLTRSLASELGRSGVRVNCISPGQIPRESTMPAFVDTTREMNALGIDGEARDMKGAAILLASDAGRFITGHNLVVDGGWSIW